MASVLLPFLALIIVQEPGDGGEKFVSSITTALKTARYEGVVKTLSIPEKDPRGLWLKLKDKAQFAAALEHAIEAAAVVELYPPVPRTHDLIHALQDILSRHVFFKAKRYPLLLALWILGTYLHRIFSYFATCTLTRQ